MTSKISDGYIRDAAKELGVEEACVRAVAEVEAPNGGFYEGGTPTVLFERHVMYKLFKEKFGSQEALTAFDRFPELCNPTAGGYGPSIAQPSRMEMAAKLLDRECALQSSSWGMFQIMGYHWKRLGFLSLQAFVNAMYASEGAQLMAFVDFIRTDPVLLKSLKNHEWVRFAERYNGPGYAKNKYDSKLAAAYSKFAGAV